MSDSQQVTTLNSKWVTKMAIFMVALVGLGTWGLIDGLWVYPNRGEKDASVKLKNYLEAARDANQLTRANVLVENPAERLADLASRERELMRIASADVVSRTTTPRAAQMELARLEWLRSLKRVWRLDSAPQRIEEDLGAQLAALDAQWKTEAQPKPLSGMDLMFQWIFVGAGYGGALWMLLIVMKAKGTRFHWDPSQMRLTLPDGLNFVPTDVREFDKRLWHKYFITIHLHDGKSRKLDLLRYVPLEEWVKTMEAAVTPEEPVDQPAPAPPAPPAEPAAAAASNGDAPHKPTESAAPNREQGPSHSA